MNEPQTHIYEFGDFRINSAKRLFLKADGEQVPHMPKAFDTLLYLVEHPGKVIEKNELMSAIWADTMVEENNLSQNISVLRRVLVEKRGEHRFIATIPGQGFKFVAEVRELTEEETNDSGIWNLESGIDEDPRPKTQDRKPSRFWLFSLAVFSLFALGGLGFYVWREKAKLAGSAPVKTIAVLPFKPLVAENRDEVLETGMADTLIARLGDSREIVVRPLSSVRRFGNLEQDAAQAGRALEVESVLDGNIQRWGDKIRVNVRLVKVADGTTLWSGTFDEKFTDIFVVQDAISNKVASALELHLGIDEKRRLTNHYTKNVEAYQLYLKGRFQIVKLKPSEIQKGISYFQQAIEIDPNYAPAYVGLASAYRSLALAAEMPSNEFLPKAKAAAQKAIEIDENLADAHAELGYNVFWYDWDWKAAEYHDRRAIELNPTSADAHFAYAHFLSDMGRPAEALAEIRRARELDPLNLKADVAEGQFLIYAGQTDEAIAKLQRTFEIDPNYWFSHMWVTCAYIDKGMYDEAVREARKAKGLSGVNTLTAAFEGYALAKSGKQAEAETVLGELLKLSNERYVPPYNIALIYNGLERRDETFNWLERGFKERDPRMVFLKVERKWNNLRAEPRFIDSMRRMNFE